MKQSLQLRLGQHLAMTPQLQQAIHLLQLSTLELQTEVQDALDSNLMLEVAEDDPADVAQLNGEADVLPADIPTELPTDSVWEDTYDAGPVSYADVVTGDAEGQRGTGESIKEHLLSQLSLLRLSDADRLIGTALIDSVGEDGYLTASLDEIRESVIANGINVEDDEVAACLRQLQNFDPPGVAARDVSECLRIQLKQLRSDHNWLDTALELVDNHLPLLASRDFTQLMKILQLDKVSLNEVIELVRSLTPRPGATIEPSFAEYVIPDVFVSKGKRRLESRTQPRSVSKSTRQQRVRTSN